MMGLIGMGNNPMVGATVAVLCLEEGMKIIDISTLRKDISLL